MERGCGGRVVKRSGEGLVDELGLVNCCLRRIEKNLKREVD